MLRITMRWPGRSLASRRSPSQSPCSPGSRGSPHLESNVIQNWGEKIESSSWLSSPSSVSSFFSIWPDTWDSRRWVGLSIHLYWSWKIGFSLGNIIIALIKPTWPRIQNISTDELIFFAKGYNCPNAQPNLPFLLFCLFQPYGHTRFYCQTLILWILQWQARFF